MAVTHTINEPSSPIGMPTEAVAMSLCETRSVLEGLLAAVNSMVRLQEEMFDRLGDIEEAIREGIEKAGEGITEAQVTRTEIKQARDDLRGHTDELKDHKEELKKQREDKNGPTGS